MPGPIAIAGASAGGGLGLILLALASKEAKLVGHAPPAGAALLSPWTDLSLSGESMRTRAQADVVLSAQALGSAADRPIGVSGSGAPEDAQGAQAGLYCAGVGPVSFAATPRS